MKLRLKRVKGITLIEVVISLVLFIIALVGGYKFFYKQMENENLNLLALDTAQRLYTLMTALEDYVKTKTFVTDTTITCQDLKNEQFITNEQLCIDKLGNTFLGIVTIDSFTQQIKNLAIRGFVSSNFASDMEKVRFFRLVNDKIIRLSEGKYRLFYLSKGQIFDGSAPYGDLISGNSNEKVQDYLNPGQYSSTTAVVSDVYIARSLEKSLGYWLWQVEVSFDLNQNLFSINFNNFGYSKFCVGGKLPLNINPNQTVPFTYAASQEINPWNTYVYTTTLCIPVHKSYVDLTKTLPGKNSSVLITDIFPNMDDTPCIKHLNQNVCCSLNNKQLGVCNEVYFPQYNPQGQLSSNYEHIGFFKNNPWLQQQYLLGTTKVNYIHYHIKVLNTYYQIFILQAHPIKTNTTASQRVFVVLIKSQQNPINFNLEISNFVSSTVLRLINNKFPVQQTIFL